MSNPSNDVEEGRLSKDAGSEILNQRLSRNIGVASAVKTELQKAVLNRNGDRFSYYTGSTNQELETIEEKMTEDGQTQYILYTDVMGNEFKISKTMPKKNYDLFKAYIERKDAFTKDYARIDLNKILQDEDLTLRIVRTRITSINDVCFMSAEFSVYKGLMITAVYILQLSLLFILTLEQYAVQPMTTFSLFIARTFVAGYIAIVIPREMNDMVKFRFKTLGFNWKLYFSCLLKYGQYLCTCAMKMGLAICAKDLRGLYAAGVGIFDCLLWMMTLVATIQIILKNGGVLSTLFKFTGLLLIGYLDNFVGEWSKIEYREMILTVQDEVKKDLTCNRDFVKEELLSNALTGAIFFITWICVISIR